MVLDLSQIAGLGPFTAQPEHSESGELLRTLYYKDTKVFLVVNKNTLEVRCDAKLGALLIEQYESVMQSRYFGVGGIELVLAGSQLTSDELGDLIRLSYNLTQ